MHRGSESFSTKESRTDFTGSKTQVLDVESSQHHLARRVSRCLLKKVRNLFQEAWEVNLLYTRGICTYPSISSGFRKRKIASIWAELQVEPVLLGFDITRGCSQEQSCLNLSSSQTCPFLLLQVKYFIVLLRKKWKAFLKKKQTHNTRMFEIYWKIVSDLMTRFVFQAVINGRN